MKWNHSFIFVASGILLLMALPILVYARQDSDGTRNKPNDGSPVGTWRGESKCVVKPSSCRDENSVYRIAAATSANRVTLTANKIVDGQEVNMGRSDCSYSRETRVLGCPLPNGSAIRLQMDGDSLTGNMKMADGTIWRKITLHRDAQE